MCKVGDKIKFSDEIEAEFEANRQFQIKHYGYYLVGNNEGLFKVFADGTKEFWKKGVDHRKGSNLICKLCEGTGKIISYHISGFSPYDEELTCNKCKGIGYETS